MTFLTLSNLRRPARTFGIIASLALMLGVAGCEPGRNLALLPGQHDAPAAYRLGSGDSIRIITFGEDQLTGEFRVGDSGSISVPLLGEIPVAGLSVQDVAKKIANGLEAAKIFKSPSVSAEVTVYRPIFILGEVTRPGQYPYQPGMTLLSAVSVAGGFTNRAVESYASIVRNSDGHVVEGKVNRQALIQPSDVVTIFERRF
ncbi:polysaccharide biosynthesis/export family protein [Acidisphaera sp. L21]|uniref:polysaccharide biosynthesis/export family protein n=1 Tax=Acidisphaera sp. L21 TaxID=1641851 RepID=UPI00131E0790|nr:polysaccharide biosynthesis/export family protein [Acidisphaera sp. L21]